MEPRYLSIYTVHPCPFFMLECPSVRICFFFSSFAFAYTPRGHEATQVHSVVTDDLRHRCHTCRRVLLALTVSFNDVNFANSYEYIRCTSSSSFSPSSTTSLPTTSLSSKASQVNSSTSSPSLATSTEACDLMRANVCRTTGRQVTCPFIDYILQNIMKTPVDLLSTDDVVVDRTRRGSQSRHQVFSGSKSMVGFIGL